MGESSASQVIKEAIASQSGNGSVEESDNGHERDLTEELEKLQNGSKESTPDVCPEYRRDSSSEESSSSSTEPEPTFTGKDCEPAVSRNQLLPGKIASLQ